VLPIHLPPLRKRREDILPLARAFLVRFSTEEGRGFRGFEPEAEAIIHGYPWPGNVRQLQNAIRRTVVLHDGSHVAAAMLPEMLTSGQPALSAGPATRSTTPGGAATFRNQERIIIEAALAAAGGNVPRAAAALDISPSTIYRKVKSWSEPARR
jgi:two-component system repressor protein LuxO